MKWKIDWEEDTDCGPCRSTYSISGVNLKRALEKVFSKFGDWNRVISLEIFSEDGKK